MLKDINMKTQNGHEAKKIFAIFHLGQCTYRSVWQTCDKFSLDFSDLCVKCAYRQALISNLYIYSQYQYNIL